MIKKFKQIKKFKEVDLGYIRGANKGPFKLAFCFSKKGNFRVSGAGKIVDKFIAQNLAPCHFREISYPRNSSGIGRWRITGNRYFLNRVRTPNRYGTELMRGYVLYRKNRFTNKTELIRYLRKIPEKFMKELEGGSVNKDF